MSRIRWAATARRASATIARAAILAAAIFFVLAIPAAAFAGYDPGSPPGTSNPAGGYLMAAKSLSAVISGLQNWIMGILVALATLFAVLAGVYYTTAAGDPAQIDKAKSSLRNALVGYALAVLAPVFLSVLKGIVGG